MPGLRAQDAHAVLEVAQELAAQRTRAERVELASRRLLELLHGEVCGYNRIDLAAGHAEVEFYPAITHLNGLGPQAMHDHPLIRHFMTTTDRLPRRVSDVAPRQEWLRSNAYGEVLKPIGTSNVLAIPIRFSPSGAEGYAVARSGRDFSARDCTVATAVQVALVALNPPKQPPRTMDELTRREHEVLVLLSEGYTAQAISHRLRISPRTVRKHLQHVYAKFGAQDRLTAVNRARVAELI
jgi:DNA-binding NarL/FixJ family response regulator